MKLKAPKGCGGVGHDGQEYPVVNGEVEVPGEVAALLILPGWDFTLPLPKPEVPEPKTEKAKGPQAGTPAPR